MWSLYQKYKNVGLTKALVRHPKYDLGRAKRIASKTVSKRRERAWGYHVIWDWANLEGFFPENKWEEMSEAEWGLAVDQVVYFWGSDDDVDKGAAFVLYTSCQKGYWNDDMADVCK
jgi:hypothetical protein